MLSERGCRLHVFHGRQFFRSDPDGPLKRLTAENPRGCWILTLSNAAIQSWFAKHEPHSVVAGSVHAGLDLPYRDLDHRAMCRHAAGMLLGLGHRKLGLVIAKSNLAGDLESEAGFLEGVSKSSRANAEAIVSRHDASVAGIQQALRRLLDRPAKPTALLVANAYHYLTVVTRLAQLGLRVPHDISVISRDDDAFLSYLTPTPARYVTSAHAFARSLLQPVVELTRNTPLVRRGQRLMPDFISGGSISQV
jgi:LacI family transcriptional regulator